MPITVRQTASGTDLATFASPVIVGSVLVAVLAERQTGDPHIVLVPSFPSYVGSTTDTSWTDLVRACAAGNDALSIQAKVATTSGQTFYGSMPIGSHTGRVVMFELRGARVGGFDSAQIGSQTGTGAINLGTFSAGAGDITIMAVQRATEADPGFDATGWAEAFDGDGAFHPWTWVAHKIGSGAAATSFSNSGVPWSAGAVLLVEGSSLDCAFEASPTIGSSPPQVLGAVPFEVTFTDLTTGDPDGWLWDFGDGDTSTDQNPVHTYTVPGHYDVTLTATRTADDDECESIVVSAVSAVSTLAGVFIDWGNDGLAP